MREGWNRINRERDIVEVFRSLRYLKMAVKHLVTDRTTRKKFKTAVQFKLIDLSADKGQSLEGKREIEIRPLHDSVATEKYLQGMALSV